MKPPSLLLVDDDTAFRQVMASELSRLGYEVDAVGTGEEAIQRIAATEPEVVLLDLRLPGMGGLETLKAIQAATPATEVIMLTGHGSIDTAIESIRIGAFDYVVKPCPLDELQIRIQRKFPLERHEGDLPHCLAGIYQDVPAARQIRSIQPEHFPHAPPQAIAPHRIPQPHRRGDPQA